MNDIDFCGSGTVHRPALFDTNRMRRVLIAEADNFVRAGIRSALKTSDDFTIVGEATSGPKVVPLARETRPDVVLLDLRIRDLDGFSCLARLRRHVPDAAVIMMVDEADAEVLSAAFAGGAAGVIMSTVDAVELGGAILEALGGSVYVPDDAPANVMTSTSTSLSARELDIVQLVARAYTNKEVAAELNITIQTVKFHLTNIYRKLGLNNRTAAARWARAAGLLYELDKAS